MRCSVWSSCTCWILMIPASLSLRIVLISHLTLCVAHIDVFLLLLFGSQSGCPFYMPVILIISMHMKHSAHFNANIKKIKCGRCSDCVCDYVDSVIYPSWGSCGFTLKLWDSQRQIQWNPHEEPADGSCVSTDTVHTVYFPFFLKWIHLLNCDSDESAGRAHLHPSDIWAIGFISSFSACGKNEQETCASKHKMRSWANRSCVIVYGSLTNKV